LPAEEGGSLWTPLEVSERVVVGVQGLLRWNSECEDLLGRGMPEIDACGVVAFVPEERDLKAAAGAPCELAAGAPDEGCRVHASLPLLVGCRRSRAQRPRRRVSLVSARS